MPSHLLGGDNMLWPRHDKIAQVNQPSQIVPVGTIDNVKNHQLGIRFVIPLLTKELMLFVRSALKPKTPFFSLEIPGTYPLIPLRYFCCSRFWSPHGQGRYQNLWPYRYAVSNHLLRRAFASKGTTRCAEIKNTQRLPGYHLEIITGGTASMDQPTHLLCQFQTCHGYKPSGNSSNDESHRIAQAVDYLNATKLSVLSHYPIFFLYISLLFFRPKSRPQKEI